MYGVCVSITTASNGVDAQTLILKMEVEYGYT